MTKFKKILSTVIIFIAVMLLICFLFSLWNVFSHEMPPTEIFQKTGLYFLYTIGYGSLEENETVQNILAMVGIVSLALMTTYLTINLFWRLDDVKLKKDILYKNDYLLMQFQNNGRTICDMKVTFTLYDEKTTENLEEPKEYYMPVLVKKSIWNITLNLNETFWYKAIYNLLTSSKKLYCVFSFVDTKTGQSSIKVEEITKENLKNSRENLEYSDFIKPVVLSCKTLSPVANNGEIQMIQKNTSVQVHYAFQKNDSQSSFVMLFYNIHDQYLNLEKYNRETTCLEMKFSSPEHIKLTIEIKLSNDNKIVKEVNLTPEIKRLSIPLKEITSSLEEVREICYTIFKKGNPLKGNLEVFDCKITTK